MFGIVSFSLEIKSNQDDQNGQRELPGISELNYYSNV